MGVYNEFASIEYRPVCGNCGAQILGRVECKEYFTIGCIYPAHQILPDRCTNCGSIFDRIEITPPKIQREDDML